MVEPTVVVHLQDTNNDDRDKSVSMLCDSCCVCFLIAVIKGFDFVTFRGLCHVALRLKENAVLQTLWSCFKRRHFSCERFFNEKWDEAHPFFCTTGKMVRCSLRPCDFNDKDGPGIRTFLRHIFVKNQQKTSPSVRFITQTILKMQTHLCWLIGVNILLWLPF